MLEFFEKTSLTNFSKYFIYLGHYYLERAEIPDYDKAALYLQQCSDQEYHFGGNYFILLFNFLSIIQIKSLFSEFELGKMYFEGKFYLQDVAKALHYWNLSSQGGHTYATYYLGLIYKDGVPDLINKDFGKALQYLMLAAQANPFHGGAQFCLGKIYLR